MHYRTSGAEVLCRVCHHLCTSWYTKLSLQGALAVMAAARDDHPSSKKAEAHKRSDVSVQDYYARPGTRIGYRLILRDRRHFGYYSSPQSSCFPIRSALHEMEKKVYEGLNCPTESKLLDAGCGTGHTALYIASAGNNTIEGVDIVERHILRARCHIKAAGMEGQVSVRTADYHRLRDAEDASFDAVYAVESLVHSVEPMKALEEFYRLLKPGGRICLNAYDREPFDKSDRTLRESVRLLSIYASMPEESSFEKESLPSLLAQAGFHDIQLEDMSENVAPMLRLFYRMGCVPFAFIPLTFMTTVGHRLGKHFTNAAAGVKSYQYRHLWRYIMVTAGKPEEPEHLESVSV